MDAKDILDEIDDYIYNEDFELDELKADKNLSKVIKGLNKNLKNTRR